MKASIEVSCVRTIRALAAAVLTATASFAVAQPAGTPDIQRGRYLVTIGGCNDCHTPGYAEAAGKVDEKLWLTGDPMGFRGP